MENKSHDTALSRLSDEALYGLYRPDCWRDLNANQRQALLQETVNREGERTGHGCQAQVTLEPLPASRTGQEAGGKIVLNEEMAVRDQMSERCGVRLITYRPPDMSYRMLETVLHEYRHVVQEEIISGHVPADDQTRLLLAANDTTTSITDQGVVNQYLQRNSSGSYELYYLQPCELDAYRTSQTRTEGILAQIQARYGSDPDMEAYRQWMSAEGWQAHITQANAFYEPANPRHVLISPSGEGNMRGRSWNLFWELFSENSPPQLSDGVHSDILELSAALFAPLENQQQPFFHLAARDVFRMTVSAFMAQAAHQNSEARLSNQALLDFLDRCSTGELLALAEPDFGYLRSYLGSPDVPTPQSLGVEGTLHAMTASQFFGSFRHKTGLGDFAIRRMVRGKGGRVIFVEHDLSRREALGPVLSVLLDLAIKEQLADGRGNLYLFLDELSVMPNVRRLSDACNLGRSRGIRTVVGVQSVEMLRHAYGEPQSNSILAGFVNAACFKAVDASTRDYISGRFGRTLEALSYGGACLTHQGCTVGDADIRGFQPGEAFCDFFGCPPFRMQLQKF